MTQTNAQIFDTVYVDADLSVGFQLEYVNRDATSYNISNAFVISSPDSISWSFWQANGGNYKISPTPGPGIWIDTTGFYSISDFGAGFQFNCLNCDGSGADTVVFNASIGDPGKIGAHPQDSGVVFKIRIYLETRDVRTLDHHCKQICIDSVGSIPSGGQWKWTSTNYSPAYSTIPSWSGVRCFLLKMHMNAGTLASSNCCVGFAGNVDCDPAGGVDISDLTRLIDFAFMEGPSLCCPAAANIDGDDWGGVDISDVTHLISYLYIDFMQPAPCIGLPSSCWY
ncbi:MAG: hypothetical protein HY851_07460 [candidate division Zixibacteria bacterium]|nr:hypothetical protein [candidate division Zixibacteria bacterium]